MTIMRIAHPTARKRLVIVGNGLATGRLLDELFARNAQNQYELVVFGEEPVGCYNRVLLSRVLSGAESNEIVLKDSDWYEKREVQFHRGVRVLRVDLSKRRVLAAQGISEPFDDLVFATGSRAAIPPLPGLHDDDALLEGAFVFRTLADCEAIREAVEPGEPAVVLGGGLLGLEAAKGLAELGMHVTVVDRGEGPMSRQLDREGQLTLAGHLNRLGIHCVGEGIAEAVLGGVHVEGLTLTNGSTLPCRVLVLACGIQPRVELMRSAGIPVNKAMRVNEWLGVEGMPHVHGLGECVEVGGELFGTVAPIWHQAQVLADVLCGVTQKEGFRPSTAYTKLKVAGIEVASFGEVGESFVGEVLTITEPRAGLYLRLRIADERLVGAQLVGDTRLAARLLQFHDQRWPVPEHRLELLADGLTGTQAADAMEVCSCHHVQEREIVSAIEGGAID
ncbi:MAG TPA: FAD-dependent oxidoreductase, partial [Polyangiaceae bacterium]|nr:FAD-dependent oxidoreductase [Polyangiaceae bacterium]